MSKDDAAMVVIDAHELAPTGSMLEAFGDFVRLRVGDGDASPATVRAYAGEVGRFVEWCKGQGIDPSTATEGDILDYRAALVKAKYSKGTIALKLAAVRRFYAAATWRGLRRDNPAEGIKAPREKTAAAEKVKYISLAGLRRLLEAPKGDSPRAIRNRAILSLMGVHGLRVSEVAGLDVASIDLTSGDAGAVRVLGKGSKERTVYLVPESAGKLRYWLQVRESLATVEELALFLDLDRARRFRGRRMTARGIRAMVDRFLIDLGLKQQGISCHSLRHSAATWARAGGAELDAIGGMLGHSSVTTTQIYAQVVNKMKENPAVFLSAMLGSDDTA